MPLKVGVEAPGSAGCRARPVRAAPATESYLETRGVQAPRNGGFPAGQRQVAIEDRRGHHIKRVDLLVGERIIVEFDGEAFHNFEGDHEIWSRLSDEVPRTKPLWDQVGGPTAVITRRYTPVGHSLD